MAIFPIIAAALPVAGGFIKRHWKVFAIGTAVVVGWIAFTSWRDNLIDTSRRAGFAQAESQYKAAVEAANIRERHIQVRLDQLTIAYGGLATQRAQEINLRLEPQIERITREVQSDPRYRECVVSERVLTDLNAGRATVDQSLSASTPR